MDVGAGFSVRVVKRLYRVVTNKYGSNGFASNKVVA